MCMYVCAYTCVCARVMHMYLCIYVIYLCNAYMFVEVSMAGSTMEPVEVTSPRFENALKGTTLFNWYGAGTLREQ